MEDINKETVEQAAENNCESMMYPYRNREKSAFIKGAKWQEKRMYTKDDLRYAFECATDLEPSFDSFSAWFEQFKNK